MNCVEPFDALRLGINFDTPRGRDERVEQHFQRGVEVMCTVSRLEQEVSETMDRGKDVLEMCEMPSDEECKHTGQGAVLRYTRLPEFWCFKCVPKLPGISTMSGRSIPAPSGAGEG
eukprot:CAMPEP_0114504462 /NCGR_PEP_ID=MMETSP0109-20121206/10234_1 /TAXON_ID=29199 /ORGANISM="Chlorarachnion reptans, Strain CCCM449" /LENGTH=115 /DNA_ID=CAMNT_0001682639 /DNA_START=198 /DNA_END=542 /DNA_ORIENTATION=-